MPTDSTRRLLLALVVTMLFVVGFGAAALENWASTRASTPPPAIDSSPQPFSARMMPSPEVAARYCANFSVTLPLDQLSPELRRRIEELSADQEAKTGIPVVNAMQQTVEERCFSTEQERNAFERARGVDPRPQQ